MAEGEVAASLATFTVPLTVPTPSRVAHGRDRDRGAGRERSVYLKCAAAQGVSARPGILERGTALDLEGA